MEIYEVPENKILEPFYKRIDDASTKEDIVDVFLDFSKSIYGSREIYTSKNINDSLSIVDLSQKSFYKYALKVYLMPAEFGFPSIERLFLTMGGTSFLDPILVDTMAIYFSNLLEQREEYLTQLKKFLEVLQQFNDEKDLSDAIEWIKEEIKNIPGVDIDDIEYRLYSLLNPNGNVVKVNQSNIYEEIKKIFMLSSDYNGLQDTIDRLPFSVVTPKDGVISKDTTVSPMRSEQGQPLIKPDLEFAEKVLRSDLAQSIRDQLPMGHEKLYALLKGKAS